MLPSSLPVEAVSDDQVLESGWEELGISDERAAEIAGAMADDDGPGMGIDFYKVRFIPTTVRSGLIKGRVDASSCAYTHEYVVRKRHFCNKKRHEDPRLKGRKHCTVNHACSSSAAPYANL